VGAVLRPEHLPHRMSLEEGRIVEIPLVKEENIYRVMRNQPKNPYSVNDEDNRNK
jgi:hypothetical protein